MLESIEKLRKWAQTFGPMGSHDPLMFADEIEREIAENFMELPKDAEGAPIRDGDTVTVETCGGGEFAVFAVARGYWVDIDGFTHKPDVTHHIKPDKLKDLVIKVMQFGYLHELPQEKWDGKACEFSDEIRELMGVDA